MRDDPTVSDSFKKSSVWEHQRYGDDFMIPADKFQFDDDDPRKDFKYVSSSLSGHERNRLFIRTEKNFADVSLISGVDNISDGRSFATFDYDNDGWLDIALMSLNAPRFKLMRNQFGDLYPDNKWLRVKLIGGMTSAEASEEFSNRDAVGTIVKATFKSGKVAMFQRQSGEGFGAQNSELIHIGIGKDDSVEHLDILWPSGKKSKVDLPESGTVVTVNEREN